MRATNRFSKISTVVAVALALSAAGCGKKKAKPTGAAGSAAGSTEGSTAGSAGSNAGSAKPAVIRSVTPQEAVDAPERTAEDKALDAGRKPVELITFLGVGRGMKAAELFAGGGYTSELLARVVGPEGVVYAQNSKDILEKFAEKPWSERLARVKMPWLVRVDRELNDPLPEEAKDLDIVVLNLVYHDTVWLGVDRTAMNGAVWKALRPGGMYAIIDHSAKDGTGADAAKDLHRIEAAFVQKEVEASGFALDHTSTMYANPADTRDWNASPTAAADKRGTTDRFVLVFRKQTGK